MLERCDYKTDHGPDGGRKTNKVRPGLFQVLETLVVLLETASERLLVLQDQVDLGFQPSQSFAVLTHFRKGSTPPTRRHVGGVDSIVERVGSIRS
jgi:hypothetical protein